MTVLLTILVGCATKAKDSVLEIKAMIPQIEERLNRRDLARLKAMGTERFESNALVIDVFGDRVNDSVTLSLDRINHSGNEATLELHMKSRLAPADAARRLTIRLLGDGRWRIDSYSLEEGNQGSPQ